MSTQPNAVPDSPVDSLRPAVMSPTRPFYWSVRRELWENRSVYIAPPATAALVLFGFFISLIHLRRQVRSALALDSIEQQEIIARPYNFAAMFIMGIAFIVALLYCLDALHGERRDRSILFWKSLPVSDLTTVLSKASIPLVVLPAFAFVLTVLTQWIMLLLSVVALTGSGVSIAALWSQVPLFSMGLMMLYHLFAIHALWYAPIYGWLLLVSAWARRAVFLWAVLPLLAIGIVEKIAFNTSHFANLLKYRFVGGPGSADFPGSRHGAMHPPTLQTLGEFLSSPGMWLGLVIAAAFLFAAVRLRRYRDPI